MLSLNQNYVNYFFQKCEKIGSTITCCLRWALARSAWASIASGPKLLVNVDVCDEMMVDSSLLSAVSLVFELLFTGFISLWSCFCSWMTVRWLLEAFKVLSSKCRFLGLSCLGSNVDFFTFLFNKHLLSFSWFNL